jgi:HAD superfamily hydrolase (TIGR01509 family)
MIAPVPPVSTVIFDWGGVFSHLPPGSTRRALERRLGLEPGMLGAFFREEDWLLFSTGRQGEQEFRSRVMAGFPRPPEGELAGQVWEHVFPTRLHLVRPGVLAVLEGLRNRVRIGLLSNAGTTLRGLIDPLAASFDDIVISAEVGCRKPDPEIFELALRRLDARPAETLFVDDFRHNVEAARELGIRGHHFITPGRLRRALDRLGLLAPTLGAGVNSSPHP